MKPSSFAAVAACAGILTTTGCLSRVATGPTGPSGDQTTPLFQQMDTNHDGQLSRAEFSAGFADAILTVYGQPRTGSVTADQWNAIERAPKSSFAALDQNKDGKLTRDELAAGPARDTVVNRIFDRIDKDHEGLISPAEGRPAGLDRTPQQRAEGTGL